VTHLRTCPANHIGSGDGPTLATVWPILATIALVQFLGKMGTSRFYV
jgi:hypothetical protein